MIFHFPGERSSLDGSCRPIIAIADDHLIVYGYAPVSATRAQASPEEEVFG